MNVMGIGIDIVDVARFKKAVDEGGGKFLKKIFTLNELDHAENKKTYFMHMAGKFAAKEAVKKALPDGAEIGLSWPEIEILNEADGKPCVHLHGRAREITEKFKLSRIMVSISHTDNTAISNAMAVGNG